ncbi:hypothetical protein VC83_00351 [Pseudogymnoascus destructans]|uniref:Uncharacterized protein n=2 Tax=Pseudogymnoascus destructans TaxID=655981 RepID=L8FRT5_PSED2|nr:uncharacterized protein VC83_00351 [Pseudogymnoascus destructans]ELR03690.1 hypothetical protein GMDG_06330 [Pseudogymnoascus destructans 20631-21]OAF63173.1 hypothetical protein VC83_00351 [Pseudogymnoascus destructans]
MPPHKKAVIDPAGLLGICDTLHGIQRTLRHSNDLVKALHPHNPTIVDCHEYESSESKPESEAYPGEDDGDSDLECALGGGAAEDEDTLLDDDDKVVELAAGEADGAV